MTERDLVVGDKLQYTGVDNHFGRDLTTGGWFFDNGVVLRRNSRLEILGDNQHTEIGPDPAMLWAVRNRRRR